MTYIDFIRPEWIELPRITPARNHPLEITTPLMQSEFLNRVVPMSETTIVTLPTTVKASAEESYEDDSRIWRSYEDDQEKEEKVWRSKPSPFSDEGRESNNYYRWRNVTFSKVASKPFLTDNVDYTILSPDVTSSFVKKTSFPKTVLIQSSTPMKHFKGTNHEIIKVNTKLDYGTTGMSEDVGEYEEHTLVNETEQEIEDYDSGTFLLLFHKKTNFNF